MSDVPVLQYHKYLNPDSSTVYSTRYFCGSCRRDLSGVYGGACYGYPGTPEDLEAENATTASARSWQPHDEPLQYYAFCPWCGVEFADEWWKDRTIQNERVIDHYQNPGTHKGDTHEFAGDYMLNHWLGVSGGDRVCWCDPEVVPGLMGCVILHQDKRFEDVMAQEREL